MAFLSRSSAGELGTGEGHCDPAEGRLAYHRLENAGDEFHRESKTAFRRIFGPSFAATGRSGESAAFKSLRSHGEVLSGRDEEAAASVFRTDFSEPKGGSRNCGY